MQSCDKLANRIAHVSDIESSRTIDSFPINRMALTRFLRLPLRDQILLFRIGLLLCAIRVGLALLPFRSLRRFLHSIVRVAPNRQAANGWPNRQRTMKAIEIMGNYVLSDGPCLTQALAAQSLLKRHGQAAHLRIGVAKRSDGTIYAHAWIESQGQILIGGKDSPQFFKILPNLEDI